MTTKRPKDLPAVTTPTAGDKMMLDGATTRSITVENFGIWRAAVTETLTNKTLTTPTVNGGTFTSLTLTSPIINGGTLGGGGGTIDLYTFGSTGENIFRAVNTSIVDPSDATKKLKFDISGVTTGTVRTLAVPNASTTIVGTDTVQTVTGKTIASSTYNGLTVTTTIGGVLTVTNNKTLAVSNSLTLAGTDSTTLTFQGTDTYVGRATTDTLTNKAISGASNTLSNIALSSLATQAAYTITGNTTGSPAAPTAFKISSLTDRAVFGIGDKLIIEESTGELRKIDYSDLPGAGGGITSITAANGVYASTNPITSTATIGVLVPVFQGRLTLNTATPVMTSSYSAQTTLYYTPYSGNYVTLYDGTQLLATAFTELSIVLGANWAANTNYDVYVGLDSGTLRLFTGAAWTNDTTRSETHTRVNGILLNTASMTGRYANASTFTCAASRGSYVGTIRIGSAGQVNYIFGTLGAGGVAGNFGVWNLYNRVPVYTFVGDTTDSWTYNVVAWRAPNGSATMRVSAIRGYDVDGVSAEYSALCLAGAGTTIFAGIGVNSTTAYSGSTGPNGNTSLVSQVIGKFSGFMGTGYVYMSALEYNSTTTASSCYGDVGSPAFFQTGLHANLFQ